MKVAGSPAVLLVLRAYHRRPIALDTHHLAPGIIDPVHSDVEPGWSTTRILGAHRRCKTKEAAGDTMIEFLLRDSLNPDLGCAINDGR